MFLADYTPARQLGNDTPLTRRFAVVLHAVRFREERQRTFVQTAWCGLISSISLLSTIAQ